MINIGEVIETNDMVEKGKILTCVQSHSVSACSTV